MHSSNVKYSIHDMLFGRTIELILLHLENAPLPIFFTLLDIITDESLLQSAKASSPIFLVL